MGLDWLLHDIAFVHVLKLNLYTMQLFLIECVTHELITTSRPSSVVTNSTKDDELTL